MRTKQKERKNGKATWVTPFQYELQYGTKNCQVWYSYGQPAVYIPAIPQ
jgi:hypothetical protein